MQVTPTTFSGLLDSWRSGNEGAGDELAQMVYDQLRFLASNYLNHEYYKPSIQTTDLVNEAWLRLFGGEIPAFTSRAHFFVIAARQMRRILIDRARVVSAHKRIPRQAILPISQATNIGVAPEVFLLGLDEALKRLEAELPRAGQVVELRYFVGLTEEQTAQILGISVTTVKRDWAFAKLWLHRYLSNQS